MSFKKKAFVSNKRIIANVLGCMAISCPLLLAACGDDSSSSSDHGIAVNEDGVLECNDDNEGQMFKVPRDSIYVTYTCENGKWISDLGGDDGIIDSLTVGEGKLKDERDGQEYKTMTIGSQTWMTENLNYRYKSKTSSLDSSSFCYNDSTKYCEKYGRLYLWSAAMDSSAVFSKSGEGCGSGNACKPKYPVRGICPEGWHLPTKDEWKQLFSAVGGEKNAGVTLKSTSGWASDGNGTNIPSFNILPAGFRGNFGDCSYETYYADLWTSTEDNETYAYFVGLDHNDNDADIDNGMKLYGFSVRCVKD